MALKVENISYEEDEGYPMLVCTIDGKKTVISAEQKPTLSRFGIVSIGLKEYVLYPEDVPEELRPLLQGSPLRGCVRDRQFWDEVYVPFVEWVNSGRPFDHEKWGNWDK